MPRGTYLCPGLREGPPGRAPGRLGPGGAPIGAPGPTPSGRAPAGATRVGCIGLRSPGRSGGRVPGAAGRAVRWKIGCPGTGRPGAGRIGAPGAGMGALYTGRGPVCGMIIRGGGVAETGGLGGALGVCTPCRLMPCAGACAGRVAFAAGTVLAGRGGIATAGGVAVTDEDKLAEGDTDGDGGVAIAGGAGGIFGGITTTDGGRMAATDAGVTSLGAGCSIGLGAAGLAVAAGASSFASMDGAATGGFATGRVAGRSAASLCCVIARSTSPGRDICDRSILVLISSSPRVAGRAALPALDPDSLRERRCLRTRSASCSSRELEWVFFSVTPTVVRASRISLLLTSSSRARSLIRIFIRSRFPLLPAQFDYYVRISNLTESFSAPL
jgi:hypothetical protein